MKGNTAFNQLIKTISKPKGKDYIQVNGDTDGSMTRIILSLISSDKIALNMMTAEEINDMTKHINDLMKLEDDCAENKYNEYQVQSQEITKKLFEIIIKYIKNSDQEVIFMGDVLFDRFYLM